MQAITEINDAQGEVANTIDPYLELHSMARMFVASYFMTPRTVSNHHFMRHAWESMNSPSQRYLDLHLGRVVRALGGCDNLEEHLRWFVDLYAISKYCSEQQSLDFIYSAAARSDRRLLNRFEHPFFGMPEAIVNARTSTEVVRVWVALSRAAMDAQFWRPEVFTLADTTHNVLIRAALRDLLAAPASDASRLAAWLIEQRLPGWRMLEVFEVRHA